MVRLYRFIAPASLAALAACVTPDPNAPIPADTNPYAPALCAALYGAIAEKLPASPDKAAYAAASEAMIAVNARWMGVPVEKMRENMAPLIEETRGEQTYWFGPQADADARTEGEMVMQDCRRFARSQPETRAAARALPRNLPQ
ncbi:hypothetical protein [Litorivita sp. NS0012-18]|uniref:hypothetical protein n=1 Tax=Litorivita sp. NS0012-18 TaxID=3127655 RepID=UPI0031052A06